MKNKFAVWFLFFFIGAIMVSQAQSSEWELLQATKKIEVFYKVENCSGNGYLNLKIVNNNPVGAILKFNLSVNEEYFEVKELHLMPEETKFGSCKMAATEENKGLQYLLATTYKKPTVKIDFIEIIP